MKKEVKWGLFVSVAVGLFFVMFFMLGELSMFKKGYTIYATYTFANGLDSNAPVRLGGISIGTVKKIEMKEDETGRTYILVTMWIEQNIRLREGSRFYINTMGLLGEKYIEISQGEPTNPHIQPLTIVKGINPMSTEELFAKGNEIASDLKEIMGQLRMIMDKNSLEDFRRIVKNMGDVLYQTKGILSDNRENIKISTSNLTASSQDLLKITDDVRKITRELSKGVDGRGEKIGQTLDDIGKMSRQLGELSDTLNAINKDIKAGKGNIGKLMNDEKVYANVEEATRELNEMIKDMKKNPKKYFSVSVF